jgi:hypothetical protein
MKEPAGAPAETIARGRLHIAADRALTWISARSSARGRTVITKNYLSVCIDSAQRDDYVMHVVRFAVLFNSAIMNAHVHAEVRP